MNICKYVYILEDLTQFTSHFYPQYSIDSKHPPKYIQDNFYNYKEIPKFI